MSRLIGPAPSRHHSPPKQPAKITISTAITIASALYPAFAGEPAAAAPRNRRRAGESRNWNATTAGARDGPPPRPGLDPSRPSSHCESWASARGFDASLGRRIPCHCLSVLALRLIAATGAPVDLYRALLCRHRCQSSINTVTRHPAPRSGGPSTSGRVVRRIPCNHTPRPSDLPSSRRESGCSGRDPQYPND